MAWDSGPFDPQIYGKELPGTFINITVTPQPNSLILDRGRVAIPMNLDWGSDDEIITVTSDDYRENCKQIFGYSYGSEELKPIDELFKHASEVQIYRLNGGGTKASGIFGTAKHSGEFGNNIVVTVEEDPDDDTEAD